MNDSFKNRQRVIQLVFFVSAIVLLGNAFYLQVWDDTSSKQADAITHDKNVLYPSRGLIYDREHKLLVNNKAMFDLMVTYNQIDPKMDTTEFCQLLDITKEQFKKNLKKNWRSGRYSKRVPFPFLKKVSSETFARFQEHLFKFPGFFIQVRNVRSYPHRSGAHLLGYISEANPIQIEKSDGKYQAGDYIGASGLELAYEDSLRGVKGVEYVLKDNLGRVVGEYKDGKDDRHATRGRGLVTSINIDLQSYGEELMQNKTGSIVAINPKTGEILAMISMPTYDPNILSINRDRGDAFTELMNDSLQPFFDRAVMAKYMPASIFKPIMGLVAMERGVTTPNRYISCPGYYNNSGTIQRCHEHSPTNNMQKAIMHSCNTYFFTLLRNTVDEFGFSNPQRGMDTLASYLNEFGLGVRLGIDYPNEDKGNIPDSKFYDRVYKNGAWRSTAITSIGIGQGELELTTLQMANLAAIIANKGYYYTPHLVRGYMNKGKEEKIDYSNKRNTVRVREEYFEPVIEGMEMVMERGTGRRGYTRDIAICGKTGTSQNPIKSKDDHSVFFGFAPKDDPEIAIAVYVEEGVWGARYATPIASLMMEYYINRGGIAENRERLEKEMKESDLINKKP